MDRDELAHGSYRLGGEDNGARHEVLVIIPNKLRTMVSNALVLIQMVFDLYLYLYSYLKLTRD